MKNLEERILILLELQKVITCDNNMHTFSCFRGNSKNPLYVDSINQDKDYSEVIKSMANTSDGATEKHVPVIAQANGNVNVTVGSVAHHASRTSHLLDFSSNRSWGAIQIPRSRF